MSEHTIEAGILALARMDHDGARLRNDVGFNGRDTTIGRSFAAQIAQGRTLTFRQRAAAYKILRTYKVQLERDHGIEFDRIEPPGEPPPEEKVTGRATLAGTTVSVVFTGYPKALLPYVKGIPGARYRGVDKTWTFTLSVETAAYVEAWPAEIAKDPALVAAIRELEVGAAASQDASRATDAEIDLPFAKDLYGFQRAGVAYAVEHGRTLIADEMGLGKTVQALATVEHQDAYPLLVVCPAVVKLNWEREARRWLPHRGVTVLVGRKPGPLNGEDIVIVNYDVLGGWAEQLTKHGFKAVVFDESHYLKNAKAKRTKAAKQMAKPIPLRLLLTGTPVLNRPIELVSQLDVLGRLDEFGGFWNFARRYCDAHRNNWGWDMTGASNLGELHERLRSTCMVRRTKDQVLGDLPPKQRISVPIEFDRTEYRKVEAELWRWMKQRLLEDREFRARIEEKRRTVAYTIGRGEVSRAEELTAEMEAEEEARLKASRLGRAKTLVLIEALKQTGAKGKLDTVVEWTREFLDAGRKLVLFAHHRDIIDAIVDRIREAGFGVTTIHGGVTGQARQDAVDRFQTEDECRLLVGQIEAAGVGITLTAASDVAFVELPWRPGDLTQAEDRCHRIGQSDVVTAWYLLAADTIEEKIAGMLDAKRAVVDHATDGAEGIAADASIQGALLDALEREAEEE